eukprot:TRINITY_DN6592_c1_g1_i1.p1 TRINITY_DN6592_c1_g1~~TRINITY_DN6592_c1_g1_i1.p1  ORF type:complete len:615 (-),score=85.05 TRINITY_DN6592_c1_g1_i1:206-2050(-)
MQRLIDCEVDFHAVHGAVPQAVAGYVRDRACRRGFGAQARERHAVNGARGKILASSRPGMLKVAVDPNGRDTAEEMSIRVLGAKLEVVEDSILEGLWVVVSCFKAGKQSSWDEAAWLLWPRSLEVTEFLACLWEAGAIYNGFETRWSLAAEPVFSKVGVDIFTAIVAPSCNNPLSTSDDEQVVVKAMRRPLTGQDVLREAAMLAAVQGHPNVIKFQSLVLLGDGENESWGIVQQWCRQGDLFSEVKNRPCDELRALAAISDVARGLEHIHSRGVVHRDIKAENVFLLRDICILGDFGSAAKETDRMEMSNPSGTLGYIALEMLLRQFSLCSYPLDVFSAGVLMYFMLSGRLPFGDGRNEAKTCRLSCSARIKYKAPEFERVSNACKGFLQVMCKGNPRDRPSASSIGSVISRLIRRATENRSMPSDDDRQGSAEAAGISESVAQDSLAGAATSFAESSQKSAVDASVSHACATQSVSSREAEQLNLHAVSVEAHSVAPTQCDAGVPSGDVDKQIPTPSVIKIDGNFNTLSTSAFPTTWPTCASIQLEGEARIPTELSVEGKSAPTPSLDTVDGVETSITQCRVASTSPSWSAVAPKGEVRSSTETWQEIEHKEH